jgi:nucleotide-binding universal stress UspA family protein
VHDVVARMAREAEAVAQTIEAPARAALKAAGCDFACCRTPPGEGAAETALRARVNDLVIMNRPGVHGAARRDAEILLRLGGAPCLLVPPKAAATRYRRVALAWNGSRQAKRALDDALPLLIGAETVHVLVADEPEWAPWSSEAVVEHLVHHGAPARLTRLSASGPDRAQLLIEACQEMGADLLVMGAFGRTPQAEHWLGGVTWSMLAAAPLPVLMSC